jgi:hypothetical protein
MEGRAGSGRAAHGKEDPHSLLCDRPCGRTHVTSVRQLPTRVVRNLLPVKRAVFAVAFHRQLLEVGRKTFQVLLVGQDGDRLRPEEIVLPDRQKTHHHGQILLEGSSAEVFVHLMETIQHRLKILRANRDYG